MSSWLDTKYLGSLAKTAIAEAQRTLDKALDIKDEDEVPFSLIFAKSFQTNE
jgi:hypothetical protein